MGNIKICDRCGKEIKSRNILKMMNCIKNDDSIRREKAVDISLSQQLKKYGLITRQYDLCYDCFMELVDWLKEKDFSDSTDDNGTAYFKDGHEEPILFYCDYEDNLVVEFHTTSGTYLYYAYLNAANKKAKYMEHAFYKTALTADDFGYIEEKLVRCYDIDRIEIFREEK